MPGSEVGTLIEAFEEPRASSTSLIMPSSPSIQAPTEEATLNETGVNRVAHEGAALGRQFEQSKKDVLESPAKATGSTRSAIHDESSLEAHSQASCPSVLYECCSGDQSPLARITIVCWRLNRHTQQVRRLYLVRQPPNTTATRQERTFLYTTIPTRFLLDGASLTPERHADPRIWQRQVVDRANWGMKQIDGWKYPPFADGTCCVAQQWFKPWRRWLQICGNQGKR